MAGEVCLAAIVLLVGLAGPAPAHEFGGFSAALPKELCVHRPAFAASRAELFDLQL
jgi:hypothetical protein